MVDLDFQGILLKLHFKHLKPETAIRFTVVGYQLHEKISHPQKKAFFFHEIMVV